MSFLSKSKDSFSKKDLESSLFWRMVVPGIVVEIVLAVICCTPIGMKINMLTDPMGGPPGIAFQLAMIPLAVLFFSYICVAGIYTIVLPCKFFKRSDKFISSVRRFLVYSVMVLSMLDLIVVSGLIEFIRWERFFLLNIPVVLGLTVFAFIMTTVFIYWTFRIYKHQNLRFFSWKTAEGVWLLIGGLVPVGVGIMML